MTDSVKRPYVSARRAAQATATRAAVLDAARDLFTSGGYTATTIQAIADTAGVAVQTIYATFGNKRELLRQIVESAVTGDASPEPVVEREAIRATMAEADPRGRAELAAAAVTRISQQLAPLMQVLQEAAITDPHFAETARLLATQRRADMAHAVKLLAGPTRSSVEREQLMGTLYVLYGPATFLALTSDFGWSVPQFQRWLADMLYRTVAARHNQDAVR